MHIEDQTITRYLLGELLPDEQKRIEERYFSDPDFLEQVLGIEDDLIDAYVREELSAHQLEWFEKYFLVSPDRRERVEIAEALRVCLGKPNASIAAPAAEAESRRQTFLGVLQANRFAVQLAFAAVVLVVVVGGSWLYIENQRQQARLDQAQLEKTRAEQQEQQRQQQLAARGNENKQLGPQEPEKTAGQTPSQKPAVDTASTSGSAIASFVLTPGLTRDIGEVNKLVIPPDARFVKLQLNLESRTEYVNYHASLQMVGAGEIWRHTFPRSTAAASKEAFTIKLPANLFVSGDYLLTLTGTTPTGETAIAGDYPLSVVNRN